MEMIKNGIRFVLCGLFMLLMSAYPSKASQYLVPTASDNLNLGPRFKNGELAFDYMSTSRLVGLKNGYMRVFYNGKKVGIEYYDDNFNVKSKKSIAMELPEWGGFYAGSDAYYLIEGQRNLNFTDGTEVIRVIKYDLAWNRKGAASIKSGPNESQIGIPFAHGRIEAVESDGILYIVTGREGYIDPQYLRGHQGFLMIAVDERTMSGKIMDGDFWHSFAQYIVSSGSDLYVLEQSEGSRYTQLSRYSGDSKLKSTIPVFKYGGSRTSAIAVSCYASVEGMALSADNILCIGTSIDQSKYDYYANADSNNDIYGPIYNIYLTLTPISDFSEEATTVKWITNYTNRYSEFLGVKITKINDNRFMISWEERSRDADDRGGSSNILHYVYIDGQGNKISKEFVESSMTISDCQPIVKGNRVVYYSSSANEVNFYSIDAENGSVNKKNYHVAGENAVWKFEKDTLTISGTGAISVELSSIERFASATEFSASYNPDKNVWTPIKYKVQRVVVEKGITSIPDQAFSSFYNLDEIVIPASVTSIGSNAFPDGAYIIAPKGSYAREYAKKNGYVCRDDLSNAKVSGIKKEYKYTGKKITPQPIVKYDGKKLKKDKDFYVEYKKNKKKGTAVIFIYGIGDYSGEIRITFKIVGTVGKDSSNKPMKVGNTFKDQKTGGYYKITKKNKTVTYMKQIGGKKSITIPDTVKIKGIKYKVTSIASRAFAGNKKITEISIGSNISSIGKQAFYNCKNLKKITIKSGKLKKSTVGIKAFKGIHSKAVIKVPKKQMSLYRKILRAKGVGSKATIRK